VERVRISQAAKDQLIKLKRATKIDQLTGPHESTAGKLAGRLFVEILRLNLQ